MKKSSLILLAAMSLVAIACNKKEKEGEILSPDEQKSYIEETALEAIDLVDLDNWKPTADFVVNSGNVISEAKFDSSVNDYFDSVSESFKVSDSKTVGDFSTIKGKFYLDGSTIKRSEANDLSAEWKLEDGTNCSANIDIKNSNTLVKIGETKTYTVSSTDNGTVVSETFINVPASVTFNAKSGKTDMVTVKVTTDLKLASSEPAPTDEVAVTASVAAGDYLVNLQRAFYSTDEVATKFSFTKGKTTIFYINFLAKGELVWDGDDIDIKKTTGLVDVEMNVLDKVEFAGKMDYTKFIALAEKYGDFESVEEAEKAAADIEDCINLYLICDNAKQAKLGFEPSTETEYGEVYITLQPVLRFTDGSAYQLPETFFSEENFKSVFDALDKLISEIESYLSGE